MTIDKRIDVTNEDILIVDDNGLTRDSLALLLDGQGFSVDDCPDGISALNLSKKKGFHVYVIDYNMPELKGDEVTSQLRKLRPDAFIIGYSIESKQQAFLSAGADKFITKDNLIIELIPSIKEAVSIRTTKD